MLQRIRFAVLALAALTLSPAAMADDNEAALAALNAGEHAAAFKHFSARANRGDVKAQNNLGVMYLRGQGTAQDYD